MAPRALPDAWTEGAAGRFRGITTSTSSRRIRLNPPFWRAQLAIDGLLVGQGVDDFLRGGHGAQGTRRTAPSARSCRTATRLTLVGLCAQLPASTLRHLRHLRYWAIGRSEQVRKSLSPTSIGLSSRRQPAKRVREASCSMRKPPCSMRKPPCSMRKPPCPSGKPLIGVRQPDECRSEAFCSIGATANCPGKALSFAGKAKSLAASLFARRARHTRLAPQGFDPCARSTKPCAQGREACT
jgi:hypothetical protein